MIHRTAGENAHQHPVKSPKIEAGLPLLLSSSPTEKLLLLWRRDNRGFAGAEANTSDHLKRCWRKVAVRLSLSGGHNAIRFIIHREPSSSIIADRAKHIFLPFETNPFPSREAVHRLLMLLPSFDTACCTSSQVTRAVNCNGTSLAAAENATRRKVNWCITSSDSKWLHALILRVQESAIGESREP